MSSFIETRLLEDASFGTAGTPATATSTSTSGGSRPAGLGATKRRTRLVP